MSNTKAVEDAIADAKSEWKWTKGEPLDNESKRKAVYAYSFLCRANGIEWKKPKYVCAEKVPLIPTKQRVDRIIGGCGKHAATVFTLMAEIAVEPEELHSTRRSQINTTDRTISIIGRKRHNSKAYKLRAETNEMLQDYLTTHRDEFPFPTAKSMGATWSKVRKKAAEKWKDPEILKIPLKNLRNYSGAQFYLNMPIRDPWAVMQHFRHKKVTTTEHYLRAMVLTGEDNAEYESKAVQTKEEAMKLADANYTYVQTLTDPSGTWHIYRKRK